MSSVVLHSVVVSVFPLDWDAVRSTCERTSVRVAGLIRSASDPGAKVPGLDWTVADVAAHLVSLTHRYEAFLRGNGEAMTTSMPDLNAEQLAAFAGRDLSELADLLERGTASLLALCPSGDAPARFFDSDSDCASTIALRVEELLVHGLDLARAAGVPWPITADEALIAIAGIAMILPNFVDREAARGFRATYELRLRRGPTLGIAFADGAATVTHGAVQRADCRISAEPVAYLLTALGRRSQWRSALTGKVLAFGRKPWLAFRFEKLIVSA